MNDPNRMMKWLFLIILVVLSLAVLYPPSEKLKGGIDLVGGTCLLFEIDTTGLDMAQQSDLSARMMKVLKDRVDPKGQLNLEWRPVGPRRLEIRMPRPPKRALERRKAYDVTRDRIKAKNLSRYTVETALNATEGQRETDLAALNRGIAERDALISPLRDSFDAYEQAKGSGDSASIDTASSEYEKAMGEFLATSMPLNRLTDILALDIGERRDGQLNILRGQFPSYDSGSAESGGKAITQAVAAYDAWAKHKADLEDPSDLKRRLRGAGVLEFRILADRDPSSPTYTQAANNPGLRQEIRRYTERLAQYGPRPKAGDRYIWLGVEDVVKFMHLDDIADFELQKNLSDQPIVEEYAAQHYVLVHADAEYGMLKSKGRKRSWSLRGARTDRDPMSGENVVSFRLDPSGGQRFGELTGNNKGRQLCIVLDNKAMSHATIQERITVQCQISGRFSNEQVQNLVRILEAGSLPARLRETPLMENTIGPSLGESNRTKGMQAAIGGTIAVALFVLFYYGIAAGGMANLALALNLLFVLSIMALLQATFTLPGIAGLILTVGMAVDANVLIFERIREERDRGVIFKRALNAGYDKAFSTIMDANLTTLITCVILGFVGSEEVKGFAITLGIGISTSMFTSLFVTRLIFNTLIAKKMLSDLKMRRIIGVPNIDWLALRKIFWPISIATSCAGMLLFVGMSIRSTEAMFDIEFLGGTSLQVDLKSGVDLSDDEMHEIIRSEEDGFLSAVGWLRSAAGHLEAATAVDSEIPGQFRLGSAQLTGNQMADLMHAAIESKLTRDGVHKEAHEVIFEGKTGMLTLATFKEAVASSAKAARVAADRLRGARVQSVGSGEDGRSFEIVTVESNRRLVQAATLACLGDKLKIQRATTYTTRVDTELTMEPFFVVESDDHYLSDVIGGNATYDIRRFRGGVTIVVDIDPLEEALTKKELDRRTREVGLQPEFEQLHARESAVIPLGKPTILSDGENGYRRFAFLAIDESLLYEDDSMQWTESLAKMQLSLVDAALGQEKSLSKVIQFSAPIAEQTRSRAMFAIVLALGAIVSYLWLRFGTKEYGLAAIVALVHDVAITLGLVAMTQFVAKTIFGQALMIEDAFRVNLPMVAAVLTVIGYSLNDTIVVFDRIRENKGRVDSLSARIINTSINQTLSRTLLTSITTFMVVLILYVFGGAGVHGFGFALMIGVVVGTYSSVGVATPLLFQPRLLHTVVVLIVTACGLGAVFGSVGDPTWRWILSGAVVIASGMMVMKVRGGPSLGRTRGVAPA